MAFAVRASDTYGASESIPGYLTIAGEVPMGAEPDFVSTTRRGGIDPYRWNAAAQCGCSRHDGTDRTDSCLAKSVS